MSKQAKAIHQSPELEKNKQLVRNFIEDTLNRHDTAAAEKKSVEDSFKNFQIPIQQ